MAEAPSWLGLSYVVLALLCVPRASTMSSSLAGALLCIGLVALSMARTDRAGRWRSVVLWPPILLMSVFLFSISQSGLSGILLQRAWTMPILALVFVMVQVVAWNVRAFKGLLLACLAAVAAMALDVIVHRLTGVALFSGPITGTGNVTQVGSLGNENDLAAICILLPIAGLALPRRPAAFWFLLLALLTMVVWLVVPSRQVMVGWFVAVVGMCLMHRAYALPDIRKGRYFALGMALVFVTTVLVVPDLRAQLLHTINEGFGDRIPLFGFGWGLFLVHPWTGIGPGAFGEYWMVGATGNIQAGGVLPSATSMPWVHNIYLEFLCETGILGCIAMGSVLSVTLARLQRRLRADQERGSLAGAVLLGLLVAGMIGLVDLSMIKDWVRFLFWLLLGLAFVAPSPAPAVNSDSHLDRPA